MNRSGRDVRVPGAAALPARLDARSARTQRALGAALVELMLAQDFDAITVQDVLDGAGVGRSTFYSHFRSKEDLLLSDAERFFTLLETHFARVAPGTMRVAPIAELFAHVDDYAQFVRALERSGQQEIVFDLFRGHLSRVIADRLRVLASAPDALALPVEVTARVCAAMALEMMRWFLDHRSEATPHELDARFHAMVWRGVPGPVRPAPR